MRGQTIARSLILSISFCCAVANGGFLDILKSKSSRHEIIDSSEDDKPIGSIEPVADVLCQWSSVVANLDRDKLSEKKQISRISTIARLVSFFDNLDTNGTGNYAYNHCANRYRQILNDLDLVLKTRPDNVCSDEKFATIEQFHNTHLSTSSGKLAGETLSARAELHPMLSLFFMYYAMEVSAICKRSVLHSLEWDLDQFKYSQEEYRLGENDNNMARLLSGISDYLGPLDRINDLDDVVYLWDLLNDGIVGKILKSTLLIDDGADEQGNGREFTDTETGSPIRLLIKVKNGQEAKFIQHKCLNRFRPVYSKVIVPVTRLSNLGYSSDGSSDISRRNKHELANNDLLKKWYSIVQICEAITPIKFYEDTSLGPNDAVIMTREEANKLEATSSYDDPPTRDERVEYEPVTNSMQDRDRLYSVDNLESQELVKRIKLNVSAHDRSVGRIFSRLLWNSFDVIKSKIFQSVGRIFVFRKPAGSHRDGPAVKYDLKKELRDSLGQLSDKELRQLEARATGESSPGRAPLPNDFDFDFGFGFGQDKAPDSYEAGAAASIGKGIILNIVNAAANLRGRAHN